MGHTGDFYNVDFEVEKMVGGDGIEPPTLSV